LSLAAQPAILEQQLSTGYFWNAIINDRMTVTTYVVGAGVTSPQALVYFDPCPILSSIRPLTVYLIMIGCMAACGVFLFVDDFKKKKPSTS
jgi:hypothetical protein